MEVSCNITRLTADLSAQARRMEKSKYPEVIEAPAPGTKRRSPRIVEAEVAAQAAERAARASRDAAQRRQHVCDAPNTRATDAKKRMEATNSGADVKRYDDRRRETQARRLAWQVKEAELEAEHTHEARVYAVEAANNETNNA